MKLRDRLTEIRDFCCAHADEARVRKYARFFTEGYDAYGLELHQMERQRDAWLAQYGEELGLPGLLSLGDLLVRSGKYEEASFAIWFAASRQDEFVPETLERLGGWLERCIRNWAHTDVLCHEVLAVFFTRQIVRLEAFAGWRTSPSRWKRRAAAVVLIEALRADVPVPRLLEFIAPMMSDEEKVVHQGLGWFLREAWKRAPKPVERFLLHWRDSCNRLIIRTATEKMTAQQKSRFKATSRKKPRSA